MYYKIETEIVKDIKIGTLSTIRKLNLDKNDLLIDKTIFTEIGNFTYIRAVLFDLRNKNRKHIQTASEKKRMVDFAKDNNIEMVTDIEFDKLIDVEEFEVDNNESNDFNW